MRKYYDLILAAFVSVLIISNITSTKIVSLWKFTFDGGTLLFPLAYIFGDVLTEVYGYKKARRAIWTGFVCLFFMAFFIMLVGWLPSAADWGLQGAYDSILGLTPRIVLGSLVAFWLGQFSNSFIMSKLKIMTKGKKLYVRTIGSTIIGEGIDTIAFILIAFYGVFDTGLIWAIFISNYIFKVAVEVVFTPVTYWIVGFLKRKEKSDVFDTNTDFNPFSV